MVLDWFAKGRGAPETVADLLARKEYEKAVSLAEQELAQRPREERLRLQLVDALVGAQRTPQAVNILSDLADELAAEGFAAKAIAALKRIQRISPGRSAIEARLADLIKKSASPAARPAAPASRPEPAFGMEEITEAPPLPEEAPAAARPAPEPDLPPAQPPAMAVPPLDPVPVPRSPLFEALTTDELAALIHGLELLMYAPGDILVAQGAPGDSLFILTTGVVKAWTRHANGHYVQVRELRDGDFFGEISVLSGRPRTATITAATYCELLELDRASLDRITALHPRVLDVMRQVYEQRVVESV
ncbi:MAG TPA: cyclic nucleotide-binding domain-containing protein [Vicinamibacteria bacterium]|nr:cyclic nucleotide-binding domain-containing protein [Vicinamibacteria bacterium]